MPSTDELRLTVRRAVRRAHAHATAETNARATSIATPDPVAVPDPGPPSTLPEGGEDEQTIDPEDTGQHQTIPLDPPPAAEISDISDNVVSRPGESPLDWLIRR